MGRPGRRSGSSGRSRNSTYGERTKPPPLPRETARRRGDATLRRAPAAASHSIARLQELRDSRRIGRAALNPSYQLPSTPRISRFWMQEMMGRIFPMRGAHPAVFAAGRQAGLKASRLGRYEEALKSFAWAAECVRVEGLQMKHDPAMDAAIRR